MTASFKGLCLGIKGSLYKPVAGCYLAFTGFLPPALPETKDLSGQPLGVGGEHHWLLPPSLFLFITSWAHFD